MTTAIEFDHDDEVEMAYGFDGTRRYVRICLSNPRKVHMVARGMPTRSNSPHTVLDYPNILNEIITFPSVFISDGVLYSSSDSYTYTKDKNRKTTENYIKLTENYP